MAKKQYRKVTLPYGNTMWVKRTTHSNIVIIYKWMKEEAERVKEEFPSVKNPRFNVSQISEGTGVARKQVSLACFILCVATSPKIYKGRLKSYASMSKFNGVRKNHLQEFAVLR